MPGRPPPADPPEPFGIAPVRHLNRYIAAHALVRMLAVTAVLAALFSFLTFVDELDQVGRGGYSVWHALSFVLLTLPNRLIPLVPVAVLLGCLLSLGHLAATRELIAMRASGITDRRIAWALGRGSLVFLALALAIMELIAPTLEQYGYQERTEALSGEGTLATARGLWSRKGHELVHIRGLENGSPVNLDIFRLGPAGESLATHIQAKRARVRSPDEWILEDAVRRRFTPEKVKVERVAALRWSSFLDPSMLDRLVVPPDSLAPSELLHYIRDLRSRGREAERYLQAFWRKVTMPVGAVAMILLASAMVFGPLGRTTTGTRLLLGTGLGMLFYLGDEIIASLGLLLDVPAGLTAAMPRLAALALGLGMFLAATRQGPGGAPRKADSPGSRDTGN